MLLFLFRLIGRQPGKSVLLSTGFLLSACALVILSAITQTTTVQSNQIISQNWRPTYDLVVLPPTVKLAAEQNVPSDYLQQYSGGISVQQYRQIKQIAGIDVAAPIAYLGYVSIPAPQIAFPNRNFAPGYYKLSWTLSAFNGQKEIVEYQQSQTYYIRPCGSIYEMYPFTAGTPLQNTQTQCPTGTSPTLSIDTPDTGTFLLAAIDPVAESQLTDLAQSVNTGRMLTAQDTLHKDDRFKSILVSPGGQRKSVQAVPLLIHQNLPGQIKLSGSLLQLAAGTETSSQAHPDGATTIFQGDVPLVQNDPQRLSNVVLAWDGKTWQPRPASSLNSVYSDTGYALDIFGATLPTGLTYQSTTAPDGASTYTLVPTGVQGPEVAFRELKPTPP